MQIKWIATVLIVVILAASGCESRQERAVRLGKAANDLEQQYRKECFDPSQSEDADAVGNALRGVRPSAEDKATFARKQQEERARIASPQCRDLKARKTAAGQEWAAAQKSASGPE